MQVCQPDLSVREGRERDHPECRHAGPTGQPGQFLLENLIFFHGRMSSLVNGGKAMYIVYLNFSKVFDIISHNVLLEKLAAYGLDGGTLGWVKSCVWQSPGSGAG